MPIGYHVSKEGRRMPEAIREELKKLRDYGVTKPCLQIFVSGPQSYNETLSNEDKAEIKNIISQEKINLVIHGAYVDNPWSLNHASIQNIKNEMKICRRIGATGVIVHIGAGAAKQDNLEHVIEELNKIDVDIKRNCILWLEINAAKKSHATVETPEKLIAFFNRVRQLNSIDDPDSLKIGLCIDSAHLYACGFAMDTYTITSQWLKDVIEGIPNLPVMMHLNDSATVFGSGKDIHSSLCNGNIWKAYNPKTGHLRIKNSGLIAILEWAENKDIDLILERDIAYVDKDLLLIRELGFFT